MGYSGQEVFDTIHPVYYFKVNAALLIFDSIRKITYIMNSEIIVLLHPAYWLKIKLMLIKEQLKENII